MKFYCVIFLLLFCFSECYSQEVKINAAGSEGSAALFSLSGDKSVLIDSVFPVSHGVYRFDLMNNHTGFYRLVINNKMQIDFIYDNEDIEIISNINDFHDSPKILESEANKIYYNFIELNKDYKTKTELLRFVLARYPKDDDYHRTTKEKLIKTQEDYLYFVNVTSQVNPNSFIARYVRSASLPVIGIEIPPEEQMIYLKTHALDNVNFYDDDLIYSNAFTNKTIEYLTYYRNPQLPLGLLEQEFMKAIDSVLSKAKVNEIVYTHIVEYLLDGFRKFGFDNVISYIVENYVVKDDICLEDRLESALERRIKQSGLFKAGYVVPNIILPDSSGKEIELKNIHSEYILIVFYASWCPHCQIAIPEIHKLYYLQKEKRVEVIAISLDTLRTDWGEFVSENSLNWTNLCDFRGWNGNSVLDYNIYAIPSMFLVDKSYSLISIIKNVDELKEYFQ